MVYAKKNENAEGEYRMTDGMRWDFTAAVKVHDPSGRTPEELGYTPFENEEAALAAWGLTYEPLPIPEPVPPEAEG